MHLRVFAYGSNLFAARMIGRIPSTQVVGRAALVRHRLRFHMRSTDGSGKADAHFTGKPEDVVQGVIYRIAAEHLAVLDRIESGYLRKSHVFERADGAPPLDAWTYHARPNRIDPRLRPYAWYHRYVWSGARAHGLPSGYLARLQEVVTIRDPERTRAAAAERSQRRAVPAVSR